MLWEPLAALAVIFLGLYLFQKSRSRRGTTNKSAKGVINIYYASQNGNSASLSQTLCATLIDQGILSYVHDINKLESHLNNCPVENMVFVLSTHYDGEAPDNAKDLARVLKDNKIKMSKCNVSVFGLGDSSYPKFNQFSKSIFELLKSFDFNM